MKRAMLTGNNIKQSQEMPHWAGISVQWPFFLSPFYLFMQAGYMGGYTADVGLQHYRFDPRVIPEWGRVGHVVTNIIQWVKGI